MGYCAEERETLIRMDELGDYWVVETNIRTMLTKISKLSNRIVINEEIEDGRVIAGTYHLPMNAISIGNGRTKRELTDAQRLELSIRLQKGRANIGK